jgi:UV excision repair protein RAD23
MKVTFRTVSGESFTLDAEESTTIGQLKGAVEEARGIPKETLKLVCKCVKSPDHTEAGERGDAAAARVTAAK